MTDLAPLLVHIAASPAPDGIQRCLSCGAALQDNRAHLEGQAMIPVGQDDRPRWWPAGALVATDKIPGSGLPSMTYTVDPGPRPRP